jgi:DNA replication protein DnaC
MTTTDTKHLHKRLNALNFPGLLSHWHELPPEIEHWIPTLVDWEEQERNQRGLERRLRAARLGNFKSLADFDWSWPSEIDRAAIKETMTLNFIEQASNLILLGPNGVGKSTIAKNIAYQALMSGHRVLFTTAATMLNDLASKDGDYALRRRLSYYSLPPLLVIDEIGYLSYGTRHADLLFEIINRRYETRATVVTTNKPFAQWNEVFPNAACVVSLVDRLVHHAEILSIDGESYRMHEAKMASEQKQQKRKASATASKRKAPRS